MNEYHVEISAVASSLYYHEWKELSRAALLILNPLQYKALGGADSGCLSHVPPAVK